MFVIARIPFPFEILDPRTQAGLPTGTYNDPNFTASTLSNVSNRVLSFVDATLGKFNGDSTVLPWPPVNPPAQTIAPTDSFQPPTTCDLTAPTAPTALTATAVSPNTINLSWTAGTDNVSITSYKVFRDGGATEIATITSGTSFSDTGLAVGSTHSYTVAAFDAANNQSAKSTSASATTQVAGALVSLTLNPTTVAAPASSTGTVTLSGAAPANGLTVTLTSSDTRKARVPQTVTVAAGQTTATFTVTTLTGNLGGGQNPVTITATLAGTGRTAVLNVLRP